jgi:hypothetical protein
MATATDPSQFQLIFPGLALIALPSLATLVTGELVGTASVNECTTA